MNFNQLKEFWKKKEEESQTTRLSLSQNYDSLPPSTAPFHSYQNQNTGRKRISLKQIRERGLFVPHDLERRNSFQPNRNDLSNGKANYDQNRRTSDNFLERKQNLNTNKQEKEKQPRKPFFLKHSNDFQEKNQKEAQILTQHQNPEEQRADAPKQHDEETHVTPPQEDLNGQDIIQTSITLKPHSNLTDTINNDDDDEKLFILTEPSIDPPTGELLSKDQRASLVKKKDRFHRTLSHQEKLWYEKQTSDESLTNKRMQSKLKHETEKWNSRSSDTLSSKKKLKSPSLEQKGNPLQFTPPKELRKIMVQKTNKVNANLRNRRNSYSPGDSLSSSPRSRASFGRSKEYELLYDSPKGEADIFDEEFSHEASFESLDPHLVQQVLLEQKNQRKSLQEHRDILQRTIKHVSKMDKSEEGVRQMGAALTLSLAKVNQMQLEFAVNESFQVTTLRNIPKESDNSPWINLMMQRRITMESFDDSLDKILYQTEVFSDIYSPKEKKKVNGIWQGHIRHHRKTSGSQPTSPRGDPDSVSPSSTSPRSSVQTPELDDFQKLELEMALLMSRQLSWHSNHTDFLTSHFEALEVYQKVLMLSPTDRLASSLMRSPTVSFPVDISKTFSVLISMKQIEPQKLICSGQEKPSDLIGRFSSIISKPEAFDSRKTVLKFGSRSEFLLEDIPIKQYENVTQALKIGKEVVLELIPFDDLALNPLARTQFDKIYFKFCKKHSRPNVPNTQPSRTISSPFQVTLNSVTASTTVFRYFIFKLFINVGVETICASKDITYDLTSKKNLTPVLIELGKKPISELPASAVLFIEGVLSKKAKVERRRTKVVACSPKIPIFNRNGIILTNSHSIVVSATSLSLIEITFQLDFGTDSIKFSNPSTSKESDKKQKELPNLNLSSSTTILDFDFNQKEVFWSQRHFLIKRKVGLVQILRSVDYQTPKCYAEIPKILSMWNHVPLVDTLYLLSSHFSEPLVREFAAKQLRHLSDSDLCDYLAPLAYALKNDIHMWSSLSSFLLERAIGDCLIRTELYWILKSNLYDMKHQLLAEACLLGCDSMFRQNLITQESFFTLLTSAAFSVQLAGVSSVRQKEFQNGLDKAADFLEMNPPCYTPLAPSLCIKALVKEKCKMFESKTFPFLLTFHTEEGEYQAMYKVGDDLRQDALVCATISLFNKIWKAEGLDLSLVGYRVVPTGPDCGWIEYVSEAATLYQMQSWHGGTTSAFSSTYVYQWMKEHCDMSSAPKRFIETCAGYCVATYLLGIGDRHNENIMVRRDGSIFHIDFGKILGDWERIGGVARDRAPFIFTKSFAHVIDPDCSEKAYEKSAKIKEFCKLCCNAYNALRKNADLIISLFSLMIPSGMFNQNSLKYLVDSFNLHMDDELAAQHFTSLIFKSLHTKAINLNFFVHNLAIKAKKSFL